MIHAEIANSDASALIRLVIGDVSTFALGSRRIVPARAPELGYRCCWTDPDAALRSVDPGTRP